MTAGPTESVGDSPKDSEHDAKGESREALPFVVCLGASAGGLEALESFFEALPPNTGASYVVVVHLSPDFKSAMPELLARHTSMEVAAAEHDEPLKPNRIHIIPPRVNMVVQNGRLQLRAQDRGAGHGVNLPIDIFLESMVSEYAERSIAIILSGTGSDGTRGIGLVKGAGGMVFVQNPDSSKFDGMPRSALASGLEDGVDSPEGLARRVSLVTRRLDAGGDVNEQAVDDQVNEILSLLRTRESPDFSYFRRSMVSRRVQRRMTLVGIREIERYIEKLQDDSREAHQLRRDLLIGVTSFFRDSQAFDALRAKFMGSYVLRLDPSEPVRIWVPACSSGQEVYSIAMLCAEANASGQRRKFSIFATDVDQQALDAASTGVYSVSEVSNVPPHLLARYFSAHGNSFHIARSIREMVIFASHNLVRDPPFTKMDLVSCRNFLIYMEPQAQEQVLASLHFALKPRGLLFLGNSESIAPLESEFESVDATSRLYRKATTTAHPALRRRSGLGDPITVMPRTVSYVHTMSRDETARDVLESLIELDGATCALLTRDGSLVEVIGDTLGLFRLSKGKPTSDATKMLPKEVAVAMTTGLHRIKKGERAVNYTVAVELAQTRLHATVHLKLLPDKEAESSKVVLVLRKIEDVSAVDMPERFSADVVETERTRALEADLRQTKETLQATIEELQTTNEEQQSTNEELVAANEELQSANEELQSVNEELHTVNIEFQRKNEDLSVMTADLDNLLQNIEVGTLFLDKNLCVRKFTSAVTNVIHLASQDIGRSIMDFSHHLATDYVEDVRSVIQTGQRVDRQVRALDGAWYHMRIVPYHTKLGVDEGVLVTFVDVTGAKNMEELARSINEQLEAANTRLIEQADELEDLFSITSHDLKRPIAALDGLLKLARKRLKETSDEANIGEKLDLAIDECARMHRMIRDLSHVSGIREPDEVEEDLDLQVWMDGIMEEFKQRAVEKGIRFNYSCDRGVVRLVRTQPEQALRNIIENAILYGSGNESPRIDVTCQIDKGMLRLSVADNGMGIAPEHHERVFELFRRLDPSVGDGSGVGLVAARRLINMAGGQVDLESDVGEGAKFTITLPVERKGDQDDKSALRRILLVEDDAVDAKTTMRLLGDIYQMTWATTLAEAKELVQSEYFDLVLLDLSLPDGHGLELLTQVRKNLRRDVPIVILTGHSGIVDERAMRASTDGYLTKAAAQQQSILLGAIAEAIASRSILPGTGRNREVALT